MSTRCLLASSLAVFAAVGWSGAHVYAADAPVAAAPAPVWSGLVPDDAFAAVVVYPKRVLADESLAKLGVRQMADDVAKQSGISPLEVEQWAVILGPPARAEKPADGPQMAVFLRLSKPHDQLELAKRLLEAGEVDTVEMAGRRLYQRRNSIGMHGEAVSFLDASSILIAQNDSWLTKLFGAVNAKSPLISALAAADPADDATAIFTNTDAAKAMIAQGLPAKAFPGPLKPLAELPDVLHAATLSIRTTPEISLKLTLIGNDEASAEKIATTIKTLQQIGQSFLPALQGPPEENMPAEQKESREYTTQIATKLVNGFVPHQSGKQVVVEIDKLGTLDALAGKALIPAIMGARAASRRIAGMNDLKQFALAMHAANDKDGHFPAHAIYSKDGKPLLSWRVYLLPLLDRTDLFNQFHLDEPWDSEHNKALIRYMPLIFQSPNGKQRPLAEGKTRYVVPVGKGTIFDGDKGISLNQITDGTSNTILVVEVGEDKAVTWTKPDDMDFDPQKPLAGLGTVGATGFAAALADGSVRVLPKNIDAETFRRLVLRNDGQPIDWSKIK